MTLILEVKIGHSIDNVHVFDVEVFIFQNNILAKVVKMIKLFCNFFKLMMVIKFTILLNLFLLNFCHSPSNNLNVHLLLENYLYLRGYL